MDCTNKQQLEELYQTVGRPALGKTMNLVQSQDVAEEIVQEVFVDLWKQRRKFDSVQQAYAWVYRCCTNKAIDHLRKKANQSVSFEEEHCPEPFDDSSPLQSSELKQVWAHIKANWKPEEISVFIYRNLEGLSQDEVAEVMNVSRRTVNRLQTKVDEKLEKIRKREGQHGE